MLTLQRSSPGAQKPIPFFITFWQDQDIEASHLDGLHITTLASPAEIPSWNAWLTCLLTHGQGGRHIHKYHPPRPRSGASARGCQGGTRRGASPPLRCRFLCRASPDEVRCLMQLAVCFLPRLQINFMLDYVTESPLFFFQESAMSWKIISVVVLHSPFL